MRILVVHNKYKQKGGEDTVVSQEIMAYKKLGHYVELYETSNEELNFFDVLFSVFNPISAYRFKKKIKKFNPDIVHLHNFIFKLSPSIIYVVPLKTKIFITIHNYRFLCPSGTLFFKEKINLESKHAIGILKNIIRGIYQDSKLKTFLLLMIYKINEKFGAFKRIDTYIFLTDFSKKIHLEWKPQLFSNNIVKPNFLIKNSIKKNFNKEIDLIYVGRFTAEKGIGDIINILISNKSLNIHLVGDGPLFEDIKQKCSNSSHLAIHGSKSREDTLILIKKSKYLIFPSIWYEGMPMTIIEAFSFGIPVICRNLGSMKNMVINNRTGLHYESTSDLDYILKNLHHYDYNQLCDLALQTYRINYSKEIGLKNLKSLLNENAD